MIVRIGKLGLFVLWSLISLVMGNSAAHLKEMFQVTEPSLEPESHASAQIQNLVDPRSPTVLFTRTPIGAEGFPIKTRSRMTSAHLIKSPDPTERGSYLNSNDAESPEDGKDMRKMCRIRFLSNDPRSPSAGIVRTPIQVESTPVVLYHKGNQEEFSPTDSLVTATSLEDLEFPPDNSPITSGNKPKLRFLDPISPHTESAYIPIQLESPSNSLNYQTADTVVTSQSAGGSEFNCKMEESGNIPDNQSKNREPVAGRETPVNGNRTNGDCLIRKLFDTPDSKELLIQAPLKARTPLQTVSANGISPQQILRVKQSHGIHQEVGRLSGIENTPPDALKKNKQLPKYNMS